MNSSHADVLAKYAQKQLCGQLDGVRGFIVDAEREIKTAAPGIMTFLQSVDKAISSLQEIKAALKEP